MSSTVEFDKTKESISKIYCANCKSHNKHKVFSSVLVSGQDEMTHSPDDFYYWSYNYEILLCLGCETGTFRTEHSNSEDWNPEYEYSYRECYPKRGAGMRLVKRFAYLPNNLERIYGETIDSFNNINFTLCATGLRSLVEGLCQENGIINGTVTRTNPDGSLNSFKKTNLEGKINGLHENGIITMKIAKILHEHRFLGNKAVHELSKPSREELILAIEILENIFENLYELGPKARRMRNRRMDK